MTRMTRHGSTPGRWLVVWLVAVSLTGCGLLKEPPYARPLPEGVGALRQLSPRQWPHFGPAFLTRDRDLVAALDRSLDWFAKPSTQQHFPHQGITHKQARASMYALRTLMAQSDNPQRFLVSLKRDFDVYTSVGWDGRGGVLYTGYYSPVLSGSTIRTEKYRYPLYQRPPDLVTDPVTGEVLGRRVGQRIEPYPTRAQIETGNRQGLGLAERELVWLANRFDAYMVHVNGSARIRLTDGAVMNIGYAGSNGRLYTSVGRLLIADGKLPENRAGLSAIRSYFRRYPDEMDRYLHQNQRYVFFQRYDGGDWPMGSLGVKVTPMRTLATDKSVFPRGGLVLVVTEINKASRTSRGDSFRGRGFERFMVDQDTGGAIRAAGRADIYMGVGPIAEQLAGAQNAEGRLYYLFLKPYRVPEWAGRMSTGSKSPPAESESTP